MKELFHIVNDSTNKVQEVLSLRVGEKHFCFAITNKEGNSIHELAYCSLGQCNEQELSACTRTYPSLNNTFYSVSIAYDHPTSLIIPTDLYHPDYSSQLLRTMAGDLYGSHIITEQMPGWQLQNIYSTPKDVQDWMRQHFPTASFRHQFTLSTQSLGIGDSGCLLADFGTEDFTLIVAKNNQLLLTSTFSYSTPEDVLYYLLKACDEFTLSQQDVKLRISGLVVKESALARELFQYFIDVEFRKANWDSKDFPAHFFTSLNDLARCAS